jgi:sugar O-acyltransferase (sialic acid O-acetyltransferase NeuD family)
VVADIVRHTPGFRIAGFLDDVQAARWGQSFTGAVILGGRNRLADLRREGIRYMTIGVGDNAARLRLSADAARAGFEFPVLRHPSAVVASDVIPGPGTVIVAGAVVNPGARIGAQVILNTGCGVDHDCEIGDGAHIGPGAHLGGWVAIGRGAWLGVGCAVMPRVRIGEGTVIGVGAAVVKDIPAGVVAYGVPARVMRTAQESPT